MRVIKSWQRGTIHVRGAGTLYVKMERSGISLVGFNRDNAFALEIQHELHERENEYIIRIRKPQIGGKR